MSIVRVVIENLAQKIAMSQKGKVYLNDLMPYLPLSINVFEHFLDEMADGTLVREAKSEGLKYYVFTELEDKKSVVFEKGKCLYSGDVVFGSSVLSSEAQNEFQKEILELAEKNAWPAEAVWQHELMYITAVTDKQLTVAEIAGHSRMRIKQVQERLKQLAKRGVATIEKGENGDAYLYRFPSLSYSKDQYLEHDAFIRSHPSSLKEELELKTIRFMVSLIAIVGICFLLVFLLRIPFQLIVLTGLGAGVLSALKIFTYKTKIEPNPI